MSGIASYEYDGVTHFHLGLIMIWNELSLPEDWGKDPPVFFPEFTAWCEEHGLNDQRLLAEKTGNCEFKFTDRGLAMMFKLRWA
jgi:hypothetical protein